MANKVTIEIDGNNAGAVKAINGVSKEMIDMERMISSKISPIMNSLKYSILGAFSVQAVSSFASESVRLAGAWQGVNNSFRFIPHHAELLEQMKQATKDTISELQLMQFAVKAENFRIPMDVFIKGLEFAKIRAQQTGESIDYMLDSFVTGTARESPKILDNLGISAKALNEEVKKTGDFMTAVGNIIDRELSTMDRSLVTTTDKTGKLTAAFENLQTEIGKDLSVSVNQGVDSLTLLLDSITNVDRTIRNFSGQGVLGNLIDGYMLMIGNVHHFYMKQESAASSHLKLVADELKAERNWLENLMSGKNKSLTEEQLELLKKQQIEVQRLNDQWNDVSRKLKNDIVVSGLSPQGEKLFRLNIEVEEYKNKFGQIPGALNVINNYLDAMLLKLVDINSIQIKPPEKPQPMGAEIMPNIDSDINMGNIQALHDAQIALDQHLTETELLNYALRTDAAMQMYDNIGNALLNFSNLSGNTNKTMFGIYKAYSMGQAAISTYTSAVEAYKAMVGIPIVGPSLAIAAAAAATAFGLSNIARIASMQPGSSVAGGVSAGGVSSPISNVSSVTNNNNTSKSVVVNIYGFVDKDLIARELIPSIEKAYKDGVGGR